MKRYIASFTKTVLCTGEFEAESVEDALEMAYRACDSSFDCSDASYNDGSMQVEAFENEI